MVLGTIATIAGQAALGWGLQKAGGLVARVHRNTWNRIRDNAQTHGATVKRYGAQNAIDRVIKWTPHGTVRNALQKVSDAANQRGMYAQTKHRRVKV